MRIFFSDFFPGIFKIITMTLPEVNDVGDDVENFYVGDQATFYGTFSKQLTPRWLLRLRKT